MTIKCKGKFLGGVYTRVNTIRIVIASKMVYVKAFFNLILFSTVGSWITYYMYFLDGRIQWLV